ncbi:MAG TPA: class I SAM-dependent methyltransferase [Thermoleophilaceae bacterium]|nr:class I SAM-dependent methyltransferase [Thermoleophilaceae bacterium]
MARTTQRDAAQANGQPSDDELAAIEREHVEEVARAHAALAEAQDRSYWLDRWGVDLNEWMRRPGASELRAAVRALRGVRRAAIKARRQGKAKLVKARREMAAEREQAVPAESAPKLFERSLTPKRLESAPATKLVFDRLSETDVDAIRSSCNVNENAIVDSADPMNQLRLLIGFGAHHGIPAVVERTGLSGDMPPEDVHAMARGSMAIAGSLYYADLVADGLETAGMTLEDGMRCLDFGCSSGRVVRALAAAYPGCEWRGCDPIEGAVTWASENLPAIDFVHSPERPPLPYGDGELDAAFAISIWSHFDEPDAVAWLAEMRRLIRPGGRLLLTTHGYQTIAHDEGHGLRQTSQLQEVHAALYDRGFWFKNEFGEGGDHGVDNSGWGTAFLTPEWLLWATVRDWRVVGFAPGRVEDNQDLYVLERR